MNKKVKELDRSAKYFYLWLKSEGYEVDKPFPLESEFTRYISIDGFKMENGEPKMIVGVFSLWRMEDNPSVDIFGKHIDNQHDLSIEEFYNYIDKQ